MNHEKVQDSQPQCGENGCRDAAPDRGRSAEPTGHEFAWLRDSESAGDACCSNFKEVIVSDLPALC